MHARLGTYLKILGHDLNSHLFCGGIKWILAIQFSWSKMRLFVGWSTEAHWDESLTIKDTNCLLSQIHIYVLPDLALGYNSSTTAQLGTNRISLFVKISMSSKCVNFIVGNLYQYLRFRSEVIHYFSFKTQLIEFKKKKKLHLKNKTI